MPNIYPPGLTPANGPGLAYTAINQKEYFVYLNDGVPFDWNEFDKSWTGEQGVERMNKSLNKAISVKPL